MDNDSLMCALLNEQKVYPLSLDEEWSPEIGRAVRWLETMFSPIELVTSRFTSR